MSETIKCNNCEQEFTYDFEIGLNVKFYEGGANEKGFWASHENPCCPNCETENRRKQTVFNAHDIKYETKYVLKKTNLLTK